MNLKLKSALAAAALLVALTGIASAQTPAPLTAAVECVAGQAVVNWSFAHDQPAYINVWAGDEVIAYKVATPATGSWTSGMVSVDLVLTATPFYLEQELPSYETPVTGSCLTTAVSIRTLSATSTPWWAFWR